jgi:hypothetical protein
MTPIRRTPLMSAVGLALVVLSTSPGQAQAVVNDQAASKAGMGMTMMADRQKMADMEASQKRLDDLVAAMNLAVGDEKVDRLAAVVTELVAQHRQMCQQMMPGNKTKQVPMFQPAAPATPPPATGKPEDDHTAQHPKP